MGWLLTHQSDEIPILDSGGTVGEHVSDQLRINFRGSVEANRSLEVVVMDVSVHSCWNDNNTS